MYNRHDNFIEAMESFRIEEGLDRRGGECKSYNGGGGFNRWFSWKEIYCGESKSSL